jgi:hypothetical protein
MSDPVAAHRFLHAMYQGTGVERRARCVHGKALCRRLLGQPARSR